MKTSKAILLLVLVGAALAVYFGGLGEYLSLAGLQSLLADARAYAAANPWTAILGFAAIYVGVIALSIWCSRFVSLLGGVLLRLPSHSRVCADLAALGATLPYRAAIGVAYEGLRERAR